MRQFSWREDEHPRGVRGRFAKKLGGAKVGEADELQDGSAKVHVTSTAKRGLKGPNRKQYQVISGDGKTSTFHDTAETAAKQALDISARKEGRDTIGLGSRAYKDLDEAEKAADERSKGALAALDRADEKEARERKEREALVKAAKRSGDISALERTIEDWEIKIAKAQTSDQKHAYQAKLNAAKARLRKVKKGRGPGKAEGSGSSDTKAPGSGPKSSSGGKTLRGLKDEQLEKEVEESGRIYGQLKNAKPPTEPGKLEAAKKRNAAALAERDRREAAKKAAAPAPPPPDPQGKLFSGEGGARVTEASVKKATNALLDLDVGGVKKFGAAVTVTRNRDASFTVKTKDGAAERVHAPQRMGIPDSAAGAREAAHVALSHQARLRSSGAGGAAGGGENGWTGADEAALKRVRDQAARMEGGKGTYNEYGTEREILTRLRELEEKKAASLGMSRTDMVEKEVAERRAAANQASPELLAAVASGNLSPRQRKMAVAYGLIPKSSGTSGPSEGFAGRIRKTEQGDYFVEKDGNTVSGLYVNRETAEQANALLAAGESIPTREAEIGPAFRALSIPPEPKDVTKPGASEIDVLRICYDGFAVSTDEIANQLGTSEHQVLGMLRSLEGKGLVTGIESDSSGVVRETNDPVWGRAREGGQYTHKTWQSNLTYDNHDWPEVEANARLAGASDVKKEPTGKTPFERRREKDAKRKQTPATERQITIIANADRPSFRVLELLALPDEELDARLRRAKANKGSGRTMGEISNSNQLPNNLMAIQQIKGDPVATRSMLDQMYTNEVKRVGPDIRFRASNWDKSQQARIATEAGLDPKAKKTEIINALIEKEIGSREGFISEQMKVLGVSNPEPAPESAAAVERVDPIEALKLYSRGDANSGYVNEKLFKATELSPEQEAYAAGLDAAMVPSAKERTVYRGVDYFYGSRERPNFAVGEELPQGGFISTSSSRSTARTFASDAANRRRGGVLLEIELPPGTPQVDVPNYTGDRKKGKHHDEEETLLPRGGRLVVTSVGKPDSDNVVTVKARFVPAGTQIMPDEKPDLDRSGLGRIRETENLLREAREASDPVAINELIDRALKNIEKMGGTPEATRLQIAAKQLRFNNPIPTGETREPGLYVKELPNGKFLHEVVSERGGQGRRVVATRTSPKRYSFARNNGGVEYSFHQSRPSADRSRIMAAKVDQPEREEREERQLERRPVDRVDPEPVSVTPKPIGNAVLSLPLGAGPSTHTGWLGRYRKMGEASGKGALLAERAAYLRAREADPIEDRDVRLSALNSAIKEAAGEKEIQQRPGAKKALTDAQARELIELHQAQNPSRDLTEAEEEALISKGYAKRSTISGMGGTGTYLGITPEGQKLLGGSSSATLLRSGNAYADLAQRDNGRRSFAAVVADAILSDLGLKRGEDYSVKTKEDRGGDRWATISLRTSKATRVVGENGEAVKALGLRPVISEDGTKAHIIRDFHYNDLKRSTAKGETPESIRADIDKLSSQRRAATTDEERRSLASQAAAKARKLQELRKETRDTSGDAKELEKARARVSEWVYFAEDLDDPDHTGGEIIDARLDDLGRPEFLVHWGDNKQQHWNPPAMLKDDKQYKQAQAETAPGIQRRLNKLAAISHVDPKNPPGTALKQVPVPAGSTLRRYRVEVDGVHVGYVEQIEVSSLPSRRWIALDKEGNKLLDSRTGSGMKRADALRDLGRFEPVNGTDAVKRRQQPLGAAA